MIPSPAPAGQGNAIMNMAAEMMADVILFITESKYMNLSDMNQYFLFIEK